MAKDTKQEAKGDIESLLMKYLSFSESILSKIPYPKIGRWLDFAKMDVKKALGAGFEYKELLKEYYVAFYLSLLITVLSFWYLIPLYAYWLGIGGLFIFFIGFMTSPLATIVILVGAILLLVILAAVIPLIVLAVGAAILHISAKIAGGTGTLRDTMNLFVCSAGANIAVFLPFQVLTAFIIGMCLGIFNYVLMFYSLYLVYLGLREVHGLTQKRAVLAILLNMLIGIALGVIALVLIYVAFLAGWVAVIAAMASSAQASIAAMFA
ncbi:MAG: YIP1 family protein [Candidatus Micrarchaeota archaeon]|nr:YIP1 family protein [Candidatus Micrarchaeota archaeon]